MADARGSFFGAPFAAVCGIIVAGTILRLILAATIGFGVDEAYTASIARHWSLSYFDHPPLHAWLIGATMLLGGSEQPFILRLPFILLFVGSNLLLFRLTALLFSARAGLWAVVALNLAPIFTISIGSWLVPDGPMVFCLLACALLVARLLLIVPSAPHAVVPWLLAGLFAGLALLSKYSAALPLAGLGLFVLSARQTRPVLRTPGPWFAIAVAVLVFSPALIWNAQNDWVSFGFQAGRARPAGFDLRQTGALLAGQLVYLLPWTFAALVCVIWHALRRGPSQPRFWFFACAATLSLGVVFLVSLRSPVLPHWTSPGWLFALPLLGEALARWETARPALITWLARGTAIFLVGTVTLLASHAATGWIGWLAPNFSAARDPLIDLVDWHDLKTEFARRNLLDGAGLVGALNWIDAAKASYALGPDVTLLCLCVEPHHFRFIADPRNFVGRDVIMVTSALRQDRIDTLRTRFERIEMLDPVTVTRGGKPVLELAIVRGIGLKG